MVSEMTNHIVASRTEMRLVADGYRAGVCNIGPAEIRRRRRAGHAGLAATAVLLAVLASMNAPPAMRLLITVPAAVSASGYLQARMRFCANYGWRGTFNLGEVGQDAPVPDAAARAADRALALRIGLLSTIIGLVVAAAAVLVPL